MKEIVNATLSYTDDYILYFAHKSNVNDVDYLNVIRSPPTMESEYLPREYNKKESFLIVNFEI